MLAGVLTGVVNSVFLCQAKDEAMGVQLELEADAGPITMLESAPV